MILIFLLGALVVPAALITEVKFGPPYWLHLVLWPAVIVGVTVALLRPLKALFVALQFRFRSTASSDDAT